MAVDGKPVEYVGQLQQVIGFRRPGDVVKVEVARKGGVRKTFNVKLQPLNDAPQVAAADEEGDSDHASAPAGAVMGRLGISVEPVSPDAAQQLQLPGETRGLIVTDVTPGGPAWEVLFDDPQRGGPDIILSVEGKPVRTEADLRRAHPGRKGRQHRHPAASTIRGPRPAAWSASGWATASEPAGPHGPTAGLGGNERGMTQGMPRLPSDRGDSPAWSLYVGLMASAHRPPAAHLQSTAQIRDSHFRSPAMTTSQETDWMNHPVIRGLIDQAATLALEERITLVKGLIPGIADALSEEEYEQFVTFIRLKGERFLEAKSHPGEGRAGRQIPGERDLEGR